MRKLLLTTCYILIASYLHAQDTVEADTLKAWKSKGVFTFLFNQTAFNNDWMAGGTSSIAGNLNINYDLNYAKDNWTWDTKFIGAYGQAKLKGDQAKKTDDRIEINSVVGLKAEGYWYYSILFNAKTQFDSGFDPDGNKISHFFSPAFFQLGPGMLWKKSDNLKVNISPLNSKLIVVHDEFTLLGPSYGVEQGKTTRYELGAAINAYYKFTLFENVTMENILNLYSNYLEDPQNIDIDYQMNLNMKVNKFLSANIAFQTIYDDNARKAFQVRQVFGLGLNYNF